MNTNITIGISSCLLGENVRYDRKSKRDNSLIEQLEQIAKLLPICPEVEIGMTVPRERINLVGLTGNYRMIAEQSGKDWTTEMLEFSQDRILKSDFRNISGLILKSKSPSCGIKTAKIIDGDSLVSEFGTGVFAAVVLKLCPSLPIIDELSLRDTYIFEKFISQVRMHAKNIDSYRKKHF